MKRKKKLTSLPIRQHTHRLLPLKHHPLHQRIRQDGQIRRRVRQKRRLRRTPDAVLRRRRHQPNPQRIARVDIQIRLHPDRLVGRRHVLLHTPLPALRKLDLQRALRPVRLLARRDEPPETRGHVDIVRLQRIVPAPRLLPPKRLVADGARPLLVVVARAHRVAGEVDARGAAQSLAARVVDLAAAEVLLRRGLVAPVHALGGQRREAVGQVQV